MNRPAPRASARTARNKTANKPAAPKRAQPLTRRAQAPRGRESAAQRADRAGRILKILKVTYPQADCALRHRSAYELLVATILSAQCTDERVNLVTPALFRTYPNAAALAQAEIGELEQLIRSTGFYRNKARNLLGMARLVCEQYGGNIPDRMDDLLKLPGVARKTANCVLGTWFRKNEGVVVDTHVGRLALRLGLLTEARDDKDAVKIEQELMRLFPRDSWTFLSHALIDHGRSVCSARKPRCAACPLSALCPSAGKLA